MDWTSNLFEEISSIFQEAGEPSFRATQLAEWLYKKAVLDPAKMTNFSGALKERLKGLGTFSVLEKNKVQESERRLIIRICFNLL